MALIVSPSIHGSHNGYGSLRCEPEKILRAYCQKCGQTNLYYNSERFSFRAQVINAEKRRAVCQPGAIALELYSGVI